MNVIVRLLVFLIWLINLSAFSLKTYAQSYRTFPSVQVYIAIPGEWESPSDPETIKEFVAMYGSSSRAIVARWELEHSDLFHLNPATKYPVSIDEFRGKKTFYSYCYFHYFTNTSPPDDIKKSPLRKG